MKLIVAGATGHVATEVIRRSLGMREFTSVVALARKPVKAPEDIPAADAAKLRSVVIKDYMHYPEDVRREFSGADACIWYVSSRPIAQSSVSGASDGCICGRQGPPADTWQLGLSPSRRPSPRRTSLKT